VYKLEKTKLNVRVELEGEALRRFKIVKEYYGMVRNTEVLHLLISQEYEELERRKQQQVKRLQVDAETYQKLEQKAKTQGLTVSQYVAQLVVESQKKE
jgi:hypothetical protein